MLVRPQTWARYPHPARHPRTRVQIASGTWSTPGEGGDLDGLALAVFIPWDVCPLGVLLRRTLDRDRRAGLERRVEELGHRLADLLAQSRPVPAEVLDVPLVKNEPRPEGDARACPRGEVPAQPAKLTVRIAAASTGPFQMPSAIRVYAPLDPRLVRQQRHVHRDAGGTARLGVMNPDLCISRRLELSTRHPARHHPNARTGGHFRRGGEVGPPRLRVARVEPDPDLAS